MRVESREVGIWLVAKKKKKSLIVVFLGGVNDEYEMF